MTERKPLLDLIAPISASEVRDHYERLIDEGKLRIVEEVEVDDSGRCSSCKHENDNPWNRHCAGCGNPIKLR